MKLKMTIIVIKTFYIARFCYDGNDLFKNMLYLTPLDTLSIIWASSLVHFTYDWKFPIF